MAGSFGRRNGGAEAASVARSQATPIEVSPRPGSSKALFRALFVFAFMMFLAVQTATGFVYGLAGGIRPKAMVAIDSLINFLFVSRIGLVPSVAVLVVLAFLFSVMAYRQAAPRN